MKKLISMMVFFCLAALLLVACGDSASSVASSPAPSPSETVSQPESAGIPASAPESNSGGQNDVNAIFDAVLPAANLGATISLSDIDLTASGNISADDVEAMAGAQSNVYAENGGMLYVVKALPGAADRISAGFEGVKEGLLSQGENYKADFPVAYANIENTRIVTKGDYVVYAVSATGDFETLDAAIEAALANI